MMGVVTCQESPACNMRTVCLIALILALTNPISARAVSPLENLSTDRIGCSSKIPGTEWAGGSDVSPKEQAIREQDELAIAKLAQAGADLDAPHTIDHYLYLTDREAAAKVADELRQSGFYVEQRLGADGTNWLVLASHKKVLTEPTLASSRRFMEALIAKFGSGEYDGWEADARPLKAHARSN